MPQISLRALKVVSIKFTQAYDYEADKRLTLMTSTYAHINKHKYIHTNIFTFVVVYPALIKLSTLLSIKRCI